jgi:hypothetical protein
MIISIKYVLSTIYDYFKYYRGDDDFIGSKVGGKYSFIVLGNLGHSRSQRSDAQWLI